jgi:hypothetical protein
MDLIDVSIIFTLGAAAGYALRAAISVRRRNDYRLRRAKAAAARRAEALLVDLPYTPTTTFSIIKAEPDDFPLFLPRPRSPRSR